MAARVRVLVNRGAGSIDDERRQRDEIVAAFRAAGAEATAEAVEPDAIGATVIEWWEADDNHPDVIVIAGGDGTVNAAAAAAAGTEVVLAVLPLGTFNHFAQDLGMPVELDEAAQAIVDGVERAVDVGEVNGEVFVNNSALGVYPSMVTIRDRIRDERGRGKVRAAPMAVLSVLRNLPIHRLDIAGSGDFARTRVRTPSVFIGNGRYENDGGGRVQRTGIDEGTLQVSVAKVVTRRGLLRAALVAMVSGADKAGDIDQTHLAEVTISAHTRHLLVARDGEVGVMTMPLRYRCRPGALKVRAPAPGQP